MALNSRGLFGYTPLHDAVANSNPKLVEKILKKLASSNIDVNCKANNGYTPLHLAASSGQEECVKILLRYGADINITDDFGKTPQDTAKLSARKTVIRLLRSEGERL